ncbi:hypothetical protein DFH07DRAFT_768262 [Mycena maculata]|uniref:Uncharacterized protein n=1 Tax=Mycena maculata TaxID=230809 RepID=A0AAD7JSS3_9AGAR|nr:hypothetical protein DFH07DRAFT_768262 [Mycena maculata]
MAFHKENPNVIEDFEWDSWDRLRSGQNYPANLLRLSSPVGYLVLDRNTARFSGSHKQEFVRDTSRKDTGKHSLTHREAMLVFQTFQFEPQLHPNFTELWSGLRVKSGNMCEASRQFFPTRAIRRLDEAPRRHHQRWAAMRLCALRAFPIKFPALYDLAYFVLKSGRPKAFGCNGGQRLIGRKVKQSSGMKSGHQVGAPNYFVQSWGSNRDVRNTLINKPAALILRPAQQLNMGRLLACQHGEQRGSSFGVGFLAEQLSVHFCWPRVNQHGEQRGFSGHSTAASLCTGAPTYRHHMLLGATGIKKSPPPNAKMVA